MCDVFLQSLDYTAQSGFPARGGKVAYCLTPFPSGTSLPGGQHIGVLGACSFFWTCTLVFRAAAGRIWARLKPVYVSAMMTGDAGRVSNLMTSPVFRRI